MSQFRNDVVCSIQPLSQQALEFRPLLMGQCAGKLTVFTVQCFFVTSFDAVPSVPPSFVVVVVTHSDDPRHQASEADHGRDDRRRDRRAASRQ
jgi:hypothetical protein